MKQNAYTVSQVNRYLARVFAEDFLLSRITVKGEISNLKYHSSGHIYFTLKDTASQLSAILFAGDRAGLTFTLENGMQVLCGGRLGVYERGGSYQLYVDRVSPDGIGELYLRFEQLKRELSERGLFDPMYKKPIPEYAKRIGIVTAKTGAAVRDIVQIAKRRNPYVELFLYPATVQGKDAAQSIAAGIAALDRLGLDVLIVGRGGGSLEDLWAFNEELVAQAIFDADTPVISAVGHETDTTIADFVADLRAPTPSAAAELAVFEYGELMNRLALYLREMRSVLERRLSADRQRYSLYSLKLSSRSPAAVLLSEKQQLSEITESLRQSFLWKLEKSRERLRSCERISGLIREKLSEKRHALSLLTEKLETASPLRKIASGFAYIQNDRGARIDSVQKLTEGELLRVQVRDGAFMSRVESIERSAQEPESGT